MVVQPPSKSKPIDESATKVFIEFDVRFGLIWRSFDGLIRWLRCDRLPPCGACPNVGIVSLRIFTVIPVMLRRRSGLLLSLLNIDRRRGRRAYHRRIVRVVRIIGIGRRITPVPRKRDAEIYPDVPAAPHWDEMALVRRGRAAADNSDQAGQNEGRSSWGNPFQMFIPHSQKTVVILYIVGCQILLEVHLPKSGGFIGMHVASGSNRHRNNYARMLSVAKVKLSSCGENM